MLKTGFPLLFWFLMLASTGCDGEREPPAPPAPSTESAAQAARPSEDTPQGPAPATPPTSSESPEVIAGFPGMTGPALGPYVGKFEHGALVNLWASWCG